MLTSAHDTSSYNSRLLMPFTVGTRIQYSMVSKPRDLDFDVYLSVEVHEMVSVVYFVDLGLRINSCRPLEHLST